MFSYVFRMILKISMVEPPGRHQAEVLAVTSIAANPTINLRKFVPPIYGEIGMIYHWVYHISYIPILVEAWDIPESTGFTELQFGT